MFVRWFALLIVPALLLNAAKKTAGSAKGENEDLILTVTLHTDPEDVKELIGDDLGGHFVVAEVKVDPKYGKDIVIDRDDFVLRTDKDGERSKPFAASQIAGRGALVIVQDEEKAKKHGWSLGGGPIMTGSSGTNISDDDKDKPKPKMQIDEQENPLRKVLDTKVLPEKKTDQPVTGLLFFPFEKQKLKDLQLLYGGKENRISLRFKP
jgi:hypothetical protein